MPVVIPTETDIANLALDECEEDTIEDIDGDFMTPSSR